MREIRNNQSPEPLFHTDNDRTFFLIEFSLHPVFAEALKQREEVTGEVLRVLAVMDGELKRRVIQEKLQLKHEDHFREAYLSPALKNGFIEMTIPDKPKSSKQKYRLTQKGKDILEKVQSKNPV